MVQRVQWECVSEYCRLCCVKNHTLIDKPLASVYGKLCRHAVCSRPFGSYGGCIFVALTETDFRLPLHCHTTVTVTVHCQCHKLAVCHFFGIVLNKTSASAEYEHNRRRRKFANVSFNK